MTTSCGLRPAEHAIAGWLVDLAFFRPLITHQNGFIIRRRFSLELNPIGTFIRLPSPPLALFFRLRLGLGLLRITIIIHKSLSLALTFIAIAIAIPRRIKISLGIWTRTPIYYYYCSLIFYLLEPSPEPPRGNYVRTHLVNDTYSADSRSRERCLIRYSAQNASL